ncbi:unnamed protein product [Urochloa humidicola]
MLATTFNHNPQVPPSAWPKQGHRALQLGVQVIAAEDCPNLTPIPQPQGYRPEYKAMGHGGSGGGSFPTSFF